VKLCKSTPARREDRLSRAVAEREALVRDIRRKARKAFLLSQQIPQLEAQVARDVDAAARLAAAEEEDTQLLEAEDRVAELKANKRQRVEESRAIRRGDLVEPEGGEEEGEEQAEGEEQPPLEPIAAPALPAPADSRWAAMFGPEFAKTLAQALRLQEQASTQPQRTNSIPTSTSSGGGDGSTSSAPSLPPLEGQPPGAPMDTSTDLFLDQLIRRTQDIHT